jgi:hypothetical protein
MFCRVTCKIATPRKTIVDRGPSGFMEFDHVTNWYLYPDKYTKMIPYFLNTYIPTFYKNVLSHSKNGYGVVENCTGKLDHFNDVKIYAACKQNCRISIL